MVGGYSQLSVNVSLNNLAVFKYWPGHYKLVQANPMVAIT